MSAIVIRSWYRMSISHWPPVATSWWCASTGIPISISVATISLRTFCIVSIGGHGKYPSFSRTLYPRFVGSSFPRSHTPSRDPT